jgi:hypothetical protein
LSRRISSNTAEMNGSSENELSPKQ